MLTDDFWVITSYFNPAGYRRRFDNFNRFREALDAPLIVAEMSRSDQFEVVADDRTQVVRLPWADVMWQKESPPQRRPRPLALKRQICRLA